MGASSSTELKNMIDSAITSAINNVGEKAYALLMQHINDNTYGTGANEQYEGGTGEPTYEFRDKAWIKSFKSELGGYVSSIMYDGSKMSPPTQDHPWRHGNGANNDNRSTLAADLNVDGVSNGFWDTIPYVVHKTRQPYWDLFIAELREKIGGWLYEEFRKEGLNIPSIKSYKG